MDVLAGMEHLQVVNLYRTRDHELRPGAASGIERADRYRPALQPRDFQRNRIACGRPCRIPKCSSPAPRWCGRRPRERRVRRRIPIKAIAAWVKAMGGSADFAGERLKAIDLSSTSVSDAQLSYLSGLTRLEKLDLQVTQVGDLGLAALEQSDRPQGAQSQSNHGLGRRPREAGRIEPTSGPQARRNLGGRTRSGAL